MKRKQSPQGTRRQLDLGLHSLLEEVKPGHGGPSEPHFSTNDVTSEEKGYFEGQTNGFHPVSERENERGEGDPEAIPVDLETVGGRAAAPAEAEPESLCDRLERLAEQDAWSAVGDLAERSLGQSGEINDGGGEDVTSEGDPASQCCASQCAARLYWVLAQLKRGTVPSTILVGPLLAAFDDLDSVNGGSSMERRLRVLSTKVAADLCLALTAVGDAAGIRAVEMRLDDLERDSGAYSRGRHSTGLPVGSRVEIGDGTSSVDRRRGGRNGHHRTAAPAAEPLSTGETARNDLHGRSTKVGQVDGLEISQTGPFAGVRAGSPGGAPSAEAASRGGRIGATVLRATVIVGLLALVGVAIQDKFTTKSKPLEAALIMDSIPGDPAIELPGLERVARVGRLDSLLYEIGSPGQQNSSGSAAPVAQMVRPAPEREGGRQETNASDLEVFGGRDRLSDSAGDSSQDQRPQGSSEERPPGAMAGGVPAQRRDVPKVTDAVVDTSGPVESDDVARQIVQDRDTLASNSEPVNNGRPRDHFPGLFPEDIGGGRGRFYRVTVNTRVMTSPSFRTGGLDQLRPGDRIFVVGREGNWFRVRSTQGRVGYVLAQDAHPE